MNRPAINQSRRGAGFTLAELLVSIAVFALLLVLISQLLTSATITTTSGRKHANADSEARLIFDRMASDFGKMVQRKDMDYLFVKVSAAPGSGANDSLFFYSESPAFAASGMSSSSANSVSLIGFRINATTLQLERFGQTLSWDGATSNDSSSTSYNVKPGGAVFLTYPGATPDPASRISGNWSKSIGTAGNNYTDGTDADYHPIGPNTYRMEITYLLDDGTISAKPILTPAAAVPNNNLNAGSPPTALNDSSVGGGSYGVNSRWYDTATRQGWICTSASLGAAIWNPIGSQDLSGLIVSLAILDPTSRVISTDFSKMVGILPDPTDAELTASPAKLPAKTWLAVVNSATFASTVGIPQLAASQVRLYQRTFYLNRN